MTRHLLSADQAAARLGVKVQTVYAYVSRGLLARTVDADGRTSRFDPVEVEELARRGRPRAGGRRPGTVDVVLSSAITQLRDERLFYRGHEVTDLVRTETFESVAELLWTGALPSSTADRSAAEPSPARHWPIRPAARRAARAATKLVPDDGPASERFAAVAAVVAATEPLRVDLRPAAVTDHARALLNLFVESVPPCGRIEPLPAGRRRRLAGHLWPRLSPLSPSRPRVRVLDAALVLLADHELATSTLAARVAASTRADPYAVVLAALGAVSGPLHGKAAIAVHDLLLDADRSSSPEAAVARVIARDERVSGFGHPVYRRIDPRATCLLALLDPLLGRRARQTIEGVLAAASRTTTDPPNVDFALGALAYVGQMPVGRTEAVFAIARTAGWVAHALEEYTEAPLRFRTRALYTGA